MRAQVSRRTSGSLAGPLGDVGEATFLTGRLPADKLPPRLDMVLKAHFVVLLPPRRAPNFEFQKCCF
jgi:hypothetical protein